MPTLAADLVNHRIPPGAIVCSPELCGNCSKRLYVRKGAKNICLGCTTAFEINAQVWSCLGCGTARKWGEGFPPLEGEKREVLAVTIQCARCCEATLHEFIEVYRGGKS